MGDVIDLSERRARHVRAVTGPAGIPAGMDAAFFFDLSSPLTYLAAERVERVLGSVKWRPVSAEALYRGVPSSSADLRLDAERRAAALGMPIVWPDSFPGSVPPAMRAAAYATEQGRGAAFALAATRLAYCGGFDLADPEVLAEAAAVAGIGLDECLRAAGDVSRDGPLEGTARRLLAAGADRLPAFAIGGSLICGEERLADAAAWARSGAAIVVPRRRDRQMVRR